ncbi:hypothetical protein EAF04_003695 [Stromatinia cepivora]|nr:hypothetical protein EAF04_003695 [Stromatinia cepivora]
MFNNSHSKSGAQLSTYEESLNELPLKLVKGQKLSEFFKRVACAVIIVMDEQITLPKEINNAFDVLCVGEEHSLWSARMASANVVAEVLYKIEAPLREASSTQQLIFDGKGVLKKAREMADAAGGITKPKKVCIRNDKVGWKIDVQHRINFSSVGEEAIYLSILENRTKQTVRSAGWVVRIR